MAEMKSCNSLRWKMAPNETLNNKVDLILSQKSSRFENDRIPRNGHRPSTNTGIKKSLGNKLF